MRQHRREGKWGWKNTEKNRARAQVKMQVRRGTMTRGVCRDRGAQKTEGHHEDYSKPLEVVWLCLKCHREVHRKKDAERICNEKAA